MILYLDRKRDRPVGGANAPGKRPERPRPPPAHPPTPTPLPPAQARAYHVAVMILLRWGSVSFNSRFLRSAFAGSSTAVFFSTGSVEEATSTS